MPNTREKLIELLSQVQDYGTKQTNEQWSVTVETKCNETIADYLIANGVTVQEWIPVSEGLPDACGNVLTYSTEYGGIDLYYYMGHGEFDHHRNGITDAQTHGFTHWMPLPQPPKGE